MSSRNNVVDGARSLLEQMKYETAQELGIQNYDSLDKGSVSSKVHGTIGGYMTKKLVAYAKAQLERQGQ